MKRLVIKRFFEQKLPKSNLYKNFLHDFQILLYPRVLLH